MKYLRDARSVLVVDWPSPDVPDALARAGLEVLVKGGPEPDRYSTRELRDGEVVARPVERPRRVDLVYCYRPIDELPGLVELAKALGAAAVWREPASDAGEAAQARRIVESAGLEYVDGDIAAAARRRRAG